MNSYPYRAVIFDLDGVLVSTDELHYQAWNKIARAEGISFDREVNDRLRGVSRSESVKIILERSAKNYSAFQRECLASAKNELYRMALDDLTPDDLSVGSVDVLNALRKQGVKTAIGSSSKNTKFILDKLRISSMFDVVSDGNGLLHSKPNPEVFLRAADKLEIEPEECLVVEDAPSGFMAATAANMDAAAIGPFADTPMARYHLKKLSDLLKLGE